MTNEIVNHVPFSFSKELFGFSGSHWFASLVDLLKITDLQGLVWVLVPLRELAYGSSSVS
jgi:hypothetical protein